MFGKASLIFGDLSQYSMSMIITAFVVSDPKGVKHNEQHKF